MFTYNKMQERFKCYKSLILKKGINIENNVAITVSNISTYIRVKFLVILNILIYIFLLSRRCQGNTKTSCGSSDLFLKSQISQQF